VSDRLARAVLLVVGVLGMAVAGVELVREAAVASEGGLDWRLAHWWAWFTQQPSTSKAGLIAAAAGVLCAVCLVLIWRLVRQPSSPLKSIDLGTPGAPLTIEAEAIDHLVGKALCLRLSEVVEARVELRREGDGLQALVRAVLRPCDLFDLHQRAAAAAREELRLASGLELARLDIEVEKFVAHDKGGT
jgi:hypothetical protein